MKQITAYEAEGKLFKTEQEAREHILDKKLNSHFRSKDGYDVLRAIVRNKETRDFLIEAFKECDQTERTPETDLKYVQEIIDNTYRCQDDVYALTDEDAMEELREYFKKHHPEKEGEDQE